MYDAKFLDRLMRRGGVLRLVMRLTLGYVVSSDSFLFNGHWLFYRIREFRKLVKGQRDVLDINLE